MSPYELLLPQFGMGMQEGTITSWKKGVGDRVELGEVICEIEAAKTTVELASPVSGVIREIVVPEDEEIEVRSVIALLDLDQ